MTPITTLIAEGNLLVREGLKAVLGREPDVKVVGEACTAAELEEKLQEAFPQVLVLDVPGSEAFQLADLTRARDLVPEVQVLVIASSCLKEEVLRVLELGVNGYLLKDCERAEIIAALRAVARGEKFICSKVLDVLLPQARPHPVSEAASLSARETEIIRLIAEGNSTVAIADKLNLSRHTINSHRKSILRKLQIKSPVELIIKAMDLGIVRLKLEE
jgi:DNA-binding NarL/FixJ family response regulator